MIKKGSVLRCSGLDLRVVDLRGSWVKCEYWDHRTGFWKPRAVTENRARLEEKIAAGAVRVLK